MIPTVDDLRSSPMVHRFGDLFAPPGLTNFLGCVQADFDVAAIRSLNFPPFGSGDTITGNLFLDGRLFLSTGAPVTFTWYPDRIVREATWGGFRVRTTTALARRTMAAMVLLEITNLEGARTVDVRLGVRAGITKRTEPWDTPESPCEFEHEISVDGSTKAITFRSPTTSASCVQATLPVPDDASGTMMSWRVAMDAGGTWELRFVAAVGDGDVTPTALTLLREMRAELDAVRADWNDELRALFTPGNTRYSGSLPELETSDASIRRIYWMGALSLAYFKRESPYSVVGRTYDTLMPRYWATTTFLWDYALSSTTHALLDPQVMRSHLELWMTKDMHTCFGTEWLTGSPVGVWYSVNDHAMTRMIAEYVRWNDDLPWLAAQVPGAGGGASVGEHLERYATNWERFRTPSGLADYGGIGNLLECVSTYVHEVAAMNAANVYNLRTAAAAAEARGRSERAEEMRAQASQLAAEIHKLYADGEGYWNARHPDGRLVPVRHCYDFITILSTMAEDLTEAQRKEMSSFFVREFHSPTWMHALSSSDPDAIFSVRPDHQWTGAYPAWPALAAQGLWRIGEHDLAYGWLTGLAKSANQGPWGQAHFAESVVQPEDGGARKAPPDLPYITDWACSSDGSWCNIVLESIFGLDPRFDGELVARPAFGPFDPDARLRNVRVGDRLYDVDARGARAVRG